MAEEKPNLLLVIIDHGLIPLMKSKKQAAKSLIYT